MFCLTLPGLVATTGNIRLSCVQIVETTTPDTRLLCTIVQQCMSRNSRHHELLIMANKYDIYSGSDSCVANSTSNDGLRPPEGTFL